MRKLLSLSLCLTLLWNDVQASLIPPSQGEAQVGVAREQRRFESQALSPLATLVRMGTVRRHAAFVTVGLAAAGLAARHGGFDWHHLVILGMIPPAPEEDSPKGLLEKARQPQKTVALEGNLKSLQI